MTAGFESEINIQTSGSSFSRRSGIHVAHIVYSFGTGGMEKGVATLIRNASADMKHTVICLTRSGDTARLLPDGTQIIELAKPPGNSLQFLPRLAKTLRTLHPDVVHTRNWAGTDGILASYLAGIHSIVHSEHGFGSENPAGDSKKRIWIYRLLSMLVKEYICVSRPLEKWLKETVRVRKPINQIYNGVDTEFYKPGPDDSCRAELGIPEQSFVIGIVASLYPIKDHATLIKAFKRLRESNPDAYLIIVGDGEERTRLEALSPEGVLFLGNRRDVPRIMRALDVFVLCSLNEGISNTILEAMGTGLPVIASNVGGNPDLVQDGITGTLFPTGDVEALTKRLQNYLLSPDERQRHGEQGRAAAVAHYNIRSMVDGYEAVWRRVAAERQR
jgi:sugar transferase (PEP-CTERM/EpsH1 system associated)